MKKVIALLLTAVMGVFLVACGAENQASDNNENVKVNEQMTSDEENESAINGIESQTTSSTEAQPTPEAEELSAPAFDTGWAGDGYVMPIPEPPFEKFTVECYENKNYVQYYVYSTDKSEVSALTQEDVVAYCELLKNNGFTNITVEMDYNKDNCMFRAFTEDDTVEVCVDCYTELGNIVIYVKQNTVA